MSGIKGMKKKNRYKIKDTSNMKGTHPKSEFKKRIKLAQGGERDGQQKTRSSGPCLYISSYRSCSNPDIYRHTSFGPYREYCFNDMHYYCSLAPCQHFQRDLVFMRGPTFFLI